jgi:hypothetical protein
MPPLFPGIRRRVAFTQLRRVFERSEASTRRALPIRKTGRGLWVPTPVRVLEEAIETLREFGLFGEGAAGHVIDAGSGDGRLPAVFAFFNPGLTVYGIEADPALHVQAVTNLQTLAARGLIGSAHVQLIEADYGDPVTYETRGVALHQTVVIFNYPDGNQRRLARFVSDRCGRDTLLCLLTHDRTLELDELTLREGRDVSAGTGAPWRLSLYSRTV